MDAMLSLLIDLIEQFIDVTDGYRSEISCELQGSKSKLEECREMLTNDVWVNRQGLDVTQQLFALAIVRKYFRGLDFVEPGMVVDRRFWSWMTTRKLQIRDSC